MRDDRFFYKIEKILPWIVLMIGSTIIYAITPFGAASTPDSLYYYNSVENFNSGHGLMITSFDLYGPSMLPLTTWPPLYPLALSFLSSILPHNEIEIIARYFNIICLTINSLIFLKLSQKIISPLFGVAITIFLIIQPPILTVYTYSWSETLFIPLILISYYFSIKAFNIHNRKTKLIYYSISTIFIVLSCYTRYIGIAFLPALFIMIFFDLRKHPENTLILLATTSTIFLFGFSPLIIYNYLKTGYLSGAERSLYKTHLFSDFIDLFYTLKLNFFNFSSSTFPSIWLIFLIIILISIYLTFKKNSLFISLKYTPSNEESFPIPFIIFSTLLWVMSYLILLIIMRNLQKFDEIDTRLISPIVPFIILFLSTFSSSYIAKPVPPKIKFPLIVLLFTWVIAQSIYSLAVFRESISSWHYNISPGLPHRSKPYNNFTGLKKIAKELYNHLNLQEDSLILSDYSKPMLIKYLFSPSTVKTLPSNLTSDHIQLSNSLANKRGVIMITTPEGMDSINRSYGDSIKLKLIQSEAFHANRPAVIGIIDLPLPLLSNFSNPD